MTPVAFVFVNSTSVRFNGTTLLQHSSNDSLLCINLIQLNDVPSIFICSIPNKIIGRKTDSWRRRGKETDMNKKGRRAQLMLFSMAFISNESKSSLSQIKLNRNKCEMNRHWASKLKSNAVNSSNLWWLLIVLLWLFLLCSNGNVVEFDSIYTIACHSRAWNIEFNVQSGFYISSFSFLTAPWIRMNCAVFFILNENALSSFHRFSNQGVEYWNHWK